MDRGNLPSVSTAITIAVLMKTCASGQQALKRIDLEIRTGEIFALLGANGAGKTTLIGIVWGIAPCPSTELHHPKRLEGLP
jgi:ABC-2 type transport system ATP-binding protein